jgi:hypothetical protein
MLFLYRLKIESSICIKTQCKGFDGDHRFRESLNQAVVAADQGADRQDAPGNDGSGADSRRSPCGVLMCATRYGALPLDAETVSGPSTPIEDSSCETRVVESEPARPRWCRHQRVGGNHLKKQRVAKTQ